MKPENIFAQIAEAGEEEQFDLLFKSPNCRIDRIVSSGHSSPKGLWYDQENEEFIFFFLCSFFIVFCGCLGFFYFYLRFIKNFQIIREEFPFFSQFFTIHLTCGVVAIVRNPGGRHSQALVGYATLPRFCTKLCLQGFFA